MKNNNFKTLLFIALCSATIPFSLVNGQEFRNNTEAISQPFVVSADSLVKLGKGNGIEQLKISLAHPTLAKVILPTAQRVDMQAKDIYAKALQSTVVVGSAYLCPRCANTHVGNATGYIISEEGIVVTNYHVLDGYLNMGEGNKPLALLVRLANGKTYTIKEVINASEKDDLAVLRLDVGEDKLPALALSQGATVGEDAYVLGHPRGMYYFFTKGMVNSKFQEAGGTQENPYSYDVMAISADFAAGASGGPVLDSGGNIIGTVSSTRTLQYNDPGRSVQMVLKTTIPVESLWKLLNKKV